MIFLIYVFSYLKTIPFFWKKKTPAVTRVLLESASYCTGKPCLLLRTVGARKLKNAVGAVYPNAPYSDVRCVDIAVSATTSAVFSAALHLVVNLKPLPH